MRQPFTVARDSSGFFAKAYYGSGSASVCETRHTADRDEAQRWADALNRGEQCPDARPALYSDD